MAQELFSFKHIVRNNSWWLWLKAKTVKGIPFQVKKKEPPLKITAEDLFGEIFDIQMTLALEQAAVRKCSHIVS